MNKFISRILSIVLVFSLVFTLSFKVSASSDFYSINWLDYSTLNDSGSNYSNITTNNSFTYTLPFKERMYSSELLIKLSGNSNRISSLTVKDEDNNSYSIDVLHLSNGYYRCLFDCEGNVIESLTFTFSLNTSSSTYCSVLQLRSSAFGSVYFSPTFDAYLGAVEAEGTNYQQFKNVNNFTTIPGDPLVGNGGFFVTMDMADWYQYDFLDWTYAIQAYDIVSVYGYVMSDDGDILFSVPVTVNELFDNTSTGQSVYSNFSISVDLTSLSKEKDSVLSIIIRGAMGSDDDYAYQGEIVCSGCTGYIKSDSYTNPLYFWLANIKSTISLFSQNMGIRLGAIAGSIDIFLQRVESLFSDLTSALSTKLTDVQTNLQSTINSFKSKVTSLFDQWFTDLFEILNPEGSEKPAEDMADKVQDQTGDLEDINNDMNDVSKPSADSIDMDLDSFVSGANLTLSTSGLSTILGNEVILQFLLMTITFAIVGYILFGKR